MILLSDNKTKFPIVKALLLLKPSKINNINRRMVKIFYSFLLLNLTWQISVAQNTPINFSFKWADGPQRIQLFGNTELYTWAYEGSEPSPNLPEFPIATGRIRIESPGSVSISILNQYTSEIDLEVSTMKDQLKDQLDIWHQQEVERGQHFLSYGFIPIYRSGSRYYKVDSLTIQITVKPSPGVAGKRSSFKSNSILRDGDFYKLGIYQNGIFRLSYNDLNSLGLNPDNIDPRTIKIYSNGGGMLPEANSDDRIDDLEEVAIFVQGQEDGRFDRDDYILFYAEGPSKFQIDLTANRITLPKNIYSTSSHVFLTVSGGQGQRINIVENGQPGTYTTNEFDDYIRFEEDRNNIGEISNFTSGGGKNWYGDIFRILRERSYSSFFNFPGFSGSSTAFVRSEFIGRCPTLSRFQIEVDGQTLISNNIASTNTGNAETAYAHPASVSGTVTINSGQPTVRVRYAEIPGQLCEGWLDFIEMQVRRPIYFNGNQIIIRDFNAINQPSATYNVEVLSTPKIWDITQPLQPAQRTAAQSGTNLTMHISNHQSYREFVLFTDNANLPKPELIGRIPNQNLHSIDRADMVIIYHSSLEQEAKRLADYRRNFSGLQVEEVTIDQVYNEFSGGSLDPVAIRDFARMIYERDPGFKYLLLFGDASYDYRNILTSGDNSQNLVPTWQTPQSLHPIFTFPSDDFYALLDPNEGATLRGAIDIAVGRIPAHNLRQARTMVDKIIFYESDPASFGDWRLRITFSADDDDNNTHINDADLIARESAQRHPVFNQDKIYLDAFPRVITPGGARFPAAKETINRNMFRGNLIFNYLGHGGATGLAQERVLTIDDINSWTNRDKLALFITATCTFSPFDDPNRISAGELTLISERGGSMALMTTTRPVFASSNRRLTQNVFNTIFERENGVPPLIGETLRRAKNFSADDTLQSNARKFLLLGDPATKLAVPRYRVETLTINGKAVDPSNPDTLKATGKYTITGRVVDDNGNLLENFNGTVTPAIFDKPITLSTLGQSQRSFVRNFDLQRNIVFRGAATVANGEFSFTFIMPKDINYTVGAGKISYYAHDGYLTDASGYDKNILIGGTADGTAISDAPPLVDLFMNSEDFAFGGITDPNPVLLVKLESENGINVTGNSVGHDLVGILNDDESNSFILNDFFEGELDDYTKGMVRYPLSNLTPGPQNIRVKAWDVVNQSAEGYLEFIVIDQNNFTIKNLYNYPNPFNRHTTIQFEHNNSFSPMDIQVLIYTVSGKLVKSMERRIIPNDFLVRDIDWDAHDDYGQRLANGVYLYKVKVSMESPDGSRSTTESDFQKMVILN